MPNMEWDIEALLSNLGVNYVSQGSKRKINGISSIREATEHELSFCWYEDKKGVRLISNSNAGVIFCKRNMKGLVQPKPGMQIIFLDNPRLVFVQVLDRILDNKKLFGITRISTLVRMVILYPIMNDNHRINWCSFEGIQQLLFQFVFTLNLLPQFKSSYSDVLDLKIN